MKPRLLKFTCHACGARLAVPPEMAGLSDHCPKCGVLVTAPTDSTVQPSAVAMEAPATPSAVSARVAAPAPEMPVPAPPPPVAPPPRPLPVKTLATMSPPTQAVPEGWSADALADALKPAPKREAPRPQAPTNQESEAKLQQPPAPPRHEPPPKPQAPSKEVFPAAPPVPGRQEVQPSLLEAPPSSPPPPAALLHLASSRKPAHEILDSILRRKSSATPAAAPEEAPIEEAPPVADIPTVENLEEELEPLEPRTALVPRQVTDVHEAKKAAMPGMGEILADSAPTPETSASPESRPLLHVPFMAISATSGEKRREWVTHLKIMAIICFILGDVLAWFIFKDDIASWWRGDQREAGTSADNSTHQPPATTVPAKSPSESPPSPQGTVASSSSDHPPFTGKEALPLLGLPDGGKTAGSASTPPGGISISAPSDFTTTTQNTQASDAAKPGAATAVPMAIPLPGHAQENIPPATSLASQAPPTPEPKETPSPTTTPPLTPLPEVPLMPSITAPSSGGRPQAPLPEAPLAPPSPTSNAVASIVTTPIPPPTTPTEASVPSPPSVPAPSPDSPPTPTDTLSSASSPVPPTVPRKVGKVPADSKSALEGLEKFLDARNWKERLSYVQKPDTVQAAMESQAAAGKDGPIVAGRIEFVERYPSKAGVPAYCMFEVSGGSLNHAVLTLVEQSSKDGARVDWEAFTEFKDDLLLRFLEKKGAPPQKFRGLLRRKHYFDRDVPDIASKDSFSLDQPNATFEGHVFVPRNSAVGKQLANQLPWGQGMPVIVELVWKSDSKAWWVQIDSIISYGWRG